MFPAVVVLLGGWIAWLVPRQVRALAYAERADDLLVRRGIMFRSLVVVPYGRMQYVDVNAGPLARTVRDRVGPAAHGVARDERVDRRPAAARGRAPARPDGLPGRGAAGGAVTEPRPTRRPSSTEPATRTSPAGAGCTRSPRRSRAGGSWSRCWPSAGSSRREPRAGHRPAARHGLPRAPRLDILLIGLIGFAYSAVAWRVTRFAVTDEAVHLRTGILFRQQRQARLDRLQAVDVVQPLLARLVGLAELKLEVAGGERVRRCRSRSCARRTRRRCAPSCSRWPRGCSARPGARRLRDGRAGAPDAPGADATPAARRRSRSRPSARSTSCRWAGSSPRRCVPARCPCCSLLVAAGAITAGIVSRDFSAAFVLLAPLFGGVTFVWSRINQGANFRAAISPDGIRLRHGLTETRAQTVPPGRVQAIRLRAGPAVARPGLVARRDQRRRATARATSSSGTPCCTRSATRGEAMTALWLVLPDLGVDDPAALVDAALDGLRTTTAASRRAPRSARWVDPVGWRRHGVPRHRPGAGDPVGPVLAQRRRGAARAHPVARARAGAHPAPARAGVVRPALDARPGGAAGGPPRRAASRPRSSTSRRRAPGPPARPRRPSSGCARSASRRRTPVRRRRTAGAALPATPTRETRRERPGHAPGPAGRRRRRRGPGRRGARQRAAGRGPPGGRRVRDLGGVPGARGGAAARRARAGHPRGGPPRGAGAAHGPRRRAARAWSRAWRTWVPGRRARSSCTRRAGSASTCSAPARAAGVIPLALHPAMTFTGTSLDLARLVGCSFAVTAPAPGAAHRPGARRRDRRRAGGAGEEARGLYHAALAHGANHLVVLVAQAAQALAAAGVARSGPHARPAAGGGARRCAARGVADRRRRRARSAR